MHAEGIVFVNFTSASDILVKNVYTYSDFNHTRYHVPGYQVIQNSSALSLPITRVIGKHTPPGMKKAFRKRYVVNKFGTEECQAEIIVHTNNF